MEGITHFFSKLFKHGKISPSSSENQVTQRAGNSTHLEITPDFLQKITGYQEYQLYLDQPEIVEAAMRALRRSHIEERRKILSEKQIEEIKSKIHFATPELLEELRKIPTYDNNRGSKFVSQGGRVLFGPQTDDHINYAIAAEMFDPDDAGILSADNDERIILYQGSTTLHVPVLFNPHRNETTAALQQIAPKIPIVGFLQRPKISE